MLMIEIGCPIAEICYETAYFSYATQVSIVGRGRGRGRGRGKGKGEGDGGIATIKEKRFLINS